MAYDVLKEFSADDSGGAAAIPGLRANNACWRTMMPRCER